MTGPVFKQMTNLSGLCRGFVALTFAHNLDPGPIRRHFESRATPPYNSCPTVPCERSKLIGQPGLTDSRLSRYGIKPTLPGEGFFKSECKIVHLLCATHQPRVARIGVLRF